MSQKDRERPDILASVGATQGHRASVGRTGWFALLSSDFNRSTAGSGIALIYLMVAGGVLLIGQAFAEARAGLPRAELLFWLGILAIIVPPTLRILGPTASRRERIVLLLAPGLALYLMKVMHNPIAFTFPDEFTHYRNVVEILQTSRLFQPNPGVAATANYPGLPIVTSALVMLSGLSVFQAGVVIIGITRTILIIGLFLVFERISQSPRVASIGVLFYVGNSNFAFWSAQYAYESFALPLAVIFLLAMFSRSRPYAEDRELRSGLTVVAILILILVTVSHHMTSYIVTGTLWATVLMYAIVYRGWRAGPVSLALLGTVMTIGWLIFASPVTITYLGPVVTKAFTSAFGLLTSHQESRPLFTSTSTGYVAPLWERMVGFASVGLAACIAPFGLWQTWRHHRTKPAAWVLTLGGMGFFPIVLMRLTSAGWETSNRAATFLFVGLAFALALAVNAIPLSLPRFPKLDWVVRPLAAMVIVIMALGGIVSGWSPKVRLAQPYVVGVGSHLVEPQGVTAARWLLAIHGPNNGVAIDAANAKYMLSYGEQTTFTRSKYGVRAMFFSDNIGRTERRVIRRTNTSFVVMDRRVISWDHMMGLYYSRKDLVPPGQSPYLDPRAYRKFDGEAFVDRVYDSGDIVIYDVRVYHYAPASDFAS